jgi:mRNA interferase RelE/StbE
MKRVFYTPAANDDLRKRRADAKRIIAKIARYAETGASDVKGLTGRPGKRLRIGAYPVIFDEDATTITVQAVGPRGNVYD